jgi:hypothetical protein
MATVHFIWWGPSRGDDSNKTPSDVALAFRGTQHSVKFWCKAENREEFATQLVGSTLPLTVESCSSVPEIVGEALYATNRQLFDQAQLVLTSLDAAKAFSAIKDLISLVILYRHGGYYLDTTTFPDLEAHTRLADAVGHPPDSPRMVQLSDGPATRHVPGLQTGRSIVSGKDPRAMVDEFFVPLVDVWAMYSPPQDPTILLAIQSYVSRANRVGLYPGGEPFNFGKTMASDVLKNEDSGREELIGNLVIRAVYDGFLMVSCKGDPNKLSEFCWPTRKLEDAVENPQQVRILPALGMRKIYKNSWRGIDLTKGANAT